MTPMVSPNFSLGGIKAIRGSSSLAVNTTLFHDLVHPGCLYYRWPRWLIRIDKALTRALRPVARLLNRRRAKVVREAFLKAVELYPDMEHEILSNISCHENIMGKELHDRYWQNLP